MALKIDCCSGVVSAKSRAVGTDAEGEAVGSEVRDPFTAWSSSWRALGAEEGSSLPFQLAPTSHHFPRLSLFWRSDREMRNGSVARRVRELEVRPPRTLRMRVMCDLVRDEEAVESRILLFLRSRIVSIMNRVRTEGSELVVERALAAAWVWDTTAFRAEGSSERSCGPQSRMMRRRSSVLDSVRVARRREMWL